MDDNERKHDSASVPVSSETPSDTTRDSSGPGDRSSGQGSAAREIGGRQGPDPVRYGDWEKNGRCIDF